MKMHIFTTPRMKHQLNKSKREVFVQDDVKPYLTTYELKAMVNIILEGNGKQTYISLSEPITNDKNIKFYLNDKQVEATQDETIWQIANRLGTEIPHLCYANKPGYRADGNCRACMVEIEGERVLAASCIRKPSADMKVQTASSKARPGLLFFPARHGSGERFRPFLEKPCRVG